jgi:hypothetical protein
VNTLTVLGYGALGGSIRGLLAIYGAVEQWVLIRRKQHADSAATKVALRKSADWPAELVATGAQLALGALAGILLYGTGTVTTVMGVILSGISAPAVLYQLGQIKSVRYALPAMRPQPSAGQDKPAEGGIQVEVTLPGGAPGGQDEDAS